MVMDGIIRAAGTSNSGAAAAAVDDDFIGDGMQCTNHPYRSNAASSGGICALCLQEKLGKLVSSSFFNAAASSSSSPPSFRSDPSAAANAASLSLTLALRPAAAASSSSSTNVRHRENQGYGYSSTNQQTSTARRARIPFLLPHKKKKAVPDYSPSNLVLKRSKSAVAPRRRTSAGEDYGNGNQKRGGFWSFLYHSKSKPDKTSSSSSSSARDLKPASQTASAPPLPPALEAAVQPLPARKPHRAEYVVVVDESVDSPNSGSSNNATSFGRKVSRSRSVGCGSRSFSGDFFERISTGFGDCTLRRVESQREGKRCSSGDVMKEKVRCAGIFGGFMMTPSSSSYWISAGEEHHHHVNGKESAAAVHGRSRSWGWALASPMRALGKPSPSSSSTRVLKSSASKSNATPNLAAIPSLLTARG